MVTMLSNFGEFFCSWVVELVVAKFKKSEIVVVFDSIEVKISRTLKVVVDLFFRPVTVEVDEVPKSRPTIDKPESATLTIPVVEIVTFPEKAVVKLLTTVVVELAAKTT